MYIYIYTYIYIYVYIYILYCTSHTEPTEIIVLPTLQWMSVVPLIYMKMATPIPNGWVSQDHGIWDVPSRTVDGGGLGSCTRTWKPCLITIGRGFFSV